MYDLILHGGEEDFKRIGIERRTIETIMRNKNLILGSWNDVGPYRAVKNVGFETWRRIVEAASKSVSVSVDTVVTTDIHRLIRLVDTLHGKTGFRKVKFPAKRLENFDPFTDAIAFKGGSEMVLVSSAPAFRLNGESFGPYRNQEVELPTAAAVLLICKGRAGVLEQSV
jgi:DNA primase small subunit